MTCIIVLLTVVVVVVGGGGGDGVDASVASAFTFCYF